VLFTDGADTSSTASLEDAIAASAAAGAPLLNVALITPDQDPEVLAELADGTEGRLLAVDELDELEGAFAQVARSLTSQYVIRYSSEILSDELDLSIVVDHEGSRGDSTPCCSTPVRSSRPRRSPSPPRSRSPSSDGSANPSCSPSRSSAPSSRSCCCSACCSYLARTGPPRAPCAEG
jgi:hypothetical protein